MTSIPESNAGGGGRILLTPFVLSLILASILVGYASADLFPGAKSGAGAIGVNRQVARAPRPAADDPAASNRREAVNGTADPFATYKDALELLKQHYYGPSIDGKKARQLTYEAIRGMLGSLHDPFTSFLAPEEWQDMEAMTE